MKRSRPFKMYFKISCLGVFFLILTGPAHAAEVRPESAHVTYLVITVDAETPSPDKIGNFPFPEQLDAKVGEVNVGLTGMMDMADAFGAPVTFFVNVYEYPLYGRDAVRQIVQTIDRRGHDVELHTHPGPTDSKGRLYMYEYSLEEQKRIIREGKDLIRDWTGRDPVAHRAGTYAANEETLEALEANGIFFDSTWYYSNPWSRRLEELGFSKNAVSRSGRIIEFPVTVFQVAEGAEVFSIRLPERLRYKKVDIDSCTLPQLLSVLEQAEEQDLDVVVLFLHSWSFVSRWSDEENERRADIEDIHDFREILRRAGESEAFQIVSMAQLAGMYREGRLRLSGRDFVPRVHERISLLKYARKRLGITRHNLLPASVAGVAASAFIFLLFYLMRKKNRALDAQGGS